ncbi:MAG: hypothetical protein JWQ27_767 [Ferruginibacter sp.]|nr:hypothetical protein [Ferruginibacter sp.]
MLAYGLLQLSPVQTWVVNKVARDLSVKLQTRVTVKKVEFHFFNKLLLEGLMVEDHRKDTLLYAGIAKADVTDWFIFKDRVALKNVELENAIVNMNRRDSVWNYQFLVDYFVDTSKSTKAKKSLNIDLGEVHFKNIRFNKIDQWVGQDMTAALKKLDLVMDSLDIGKKRILIRELYMEEPYFAQHDYKGNKPPQPTLASVLEKVPVISAFKWNNSGWVLQLKKFQVFNGSFRNDKYTERAPFTDKFDGQHLLFSSITGSMNNVYFLNDTLAADLSLSARERSGLNLKKFKTNLRFTPELMEFKALELVSNKSSLGNYFAMRYNAFNQDMSSFIHAVTLDANFKDSYLSSDDLAIFAPALKSWKRTFFLDGTAKGTVDNFSTRTMTIRSGNSLISGDLAMRGLPDIKSTFIDLHAKNLVTNYNDLVTIMPALRKVTKPAIAKLGTIRYAGNFTGFLNDFVTYGTFNTSLGSLTADLNMKLPTGRPAAYSGRISTPGFNVGSFINSPELGIVALNSKISGHGFTLDELNANVDGTVSRLDFAKYSYKNITINGDFEKKLFKGHLSINDPNLQIRDLDGELNLSTKEIAFNLDANLQHANLKQLHLTNDNLTLNGVFSLNFTGNNIDNFLGTARVYSATLQHDSTRLSFDSLTLRSQIVDNKKRLSLQSNEIDAEINGVFSIKELPAAFEVLLARYYPTYFKVPKYWVNSKQDFSFAIRTNQVDEYIRLFNQKLRGFNNSTINGRLKLDSYELSLEAKVPEFSYDNKLFTNTLLIGNGNRDTLLADISVEDIMMSDSLHLPGTRLKLAASNDVSLIKLNTSASKTLSDAELNASIQTLSDGFRVHFFPSSFVINDKRWQLEKDGEITLRKKFIDANEVKFVHENQQIVFSTELDDVNDNTHLVARMQNVNIGDFAPFIISKPGLKGLLSGTATVRDPFGKTTIEFLGVADSFSLDDKYIGKVNLSANANLGTGIVQFKTSADDQDYVFNVDGNYNYKDSTGNQMDINFLSERFNINILEPYLGTIFSKMNGIARTNLKVSGGKGHQYLTGEATLLDGSVKVAYTQCKYLFSNHTLKFGKDVIDLGLLKLKDTLGNEGSVSGKMYHHFFKEFSFEGMRFETSKMLVLNTTKKDNSQFYGTVIGSAVMTMAGPVTNLKMNIDGQPSATDSSHIYLPTGNSKENNAIDYIEFIQFGSEMDARESRNTAANIVVNMNLNVNPACKIDVILDEETGDILKGQGVGNLNIRVGNKEPLTMRGKYNLTKGEYTFNFQTFLKKPFTLSQGSITWNGDPYEAIIDIDAEYLAKNVDISSLTSSNSFRQKEDITITAHLTDRLKSPKISFELQLPEKSELNRDYIVVKRLADYRNDDNVMNKQVASLLLFNSFVTDNQNFLSQENTISLATSTIGGVISGWLTNIFNRELDKATKGVISTYIDINPSLDLQNKANQLQANVRAGLKILLSNRLNILIGGNLDYNNPYTQLDRKGLITPDITIEWLLNKDGSLRVVGFTRTSFTDVTTGQRNRSGLQLSYRKDFNRLSDIFRTKKTLQERDAQTQVKAVE